MARQGRRIILTPRAVILTTIWHPLKRNLLLPNTYPHIGLRLFVGILARKMRFTSIVFGQRKPLRLRVNLSHVKIKARSAMKRIVLFVIVAVSLAVSTTTSARAADSSNSHGYLGHISPGHGYAVYGHRPQHNYVGHGYAAPTYGHGVVQHGYVGHGYVGSSHGGYPYSSYGHGGYVRVSTPHFGIRIGH